MAGTFGSGIKSVQRGVKTLTGTTCAQTITAVVMAKAVLIWAGHATSSAQCGAYLTATTTITFDRSGDVGSNNISWEVIEYY